MKVMEEKINIKHLLKKVVNYWWYFLIAALIFIPAAYFYILVSHEVYSVKAAVLVKNEEQEASTNDNFLRGMNLLDTHTELEDEVGMLGSYSMIQTTLQQLDFGVSYFEDLGFKNVELYNESAFF